MTPTQWCPSCRQVRGPLGGPCSVCGTTLGPLPEPVWATDSECPMCFGSGLIWFEVAGGDPEAPTEVPEDCPDCHGLGYVEGDL